MALEIKKKERETPQSLVRRFSRALQQSGILLRVRERTFKSREKSKNIRRRTALRREELKKKYEKLKKLGELG